MRILLLITLLSTSLISNAQPVFSGEDFSGVYQCDGQDHLEGSYKGKVTIKLVADKSSGEYGAYQFKLEVPGFGEYPGHAAAQGKKLAIYFANTDLATKDFGTGIANFSKNKAGTGIPIIDLCFVFVLLPMRSTYNCQLAKTTVSHPSLMPICKFIVSDIIL